MQPGDVFVPHEVFGAALRPDAVRYSSDLTDEVKTAWFVLALYAVYDDAEYPTLARLQHLFGVGRVRSRQLIAELEACDLIEARSCAGSRKRRFVFLWAAVCEKKVRPPKKPPMSAGLEDVGSIVTALGYELR